MFKFLFVIVYSMTLIYGGSLENDGDIPNNTTNDLKKVTDIVYYNIKTNQVLQSLKKFSLGPVPNSGLRQTSAGPCSCVGVRCSCCAGIRISGFGFDRQACAVLIYEPVASLIDMELAINNRTLYMNKFSTRDQQVCLPLIPITLLGPVDFCVRLFEISVVRQRLHACLGMLTRIARQPVITIQFNCMEMGFDGIGLTNPNDTYYLGAPPAGNVTTSTLETPQPQTDSNDIFDPVVESESVENPRTKLT